MDQIIQRIRRLQLAVAACLFVVVICGCGREDKPRVNPPPPASVERDAESSTDSGPIVADTNGEQPSSGPASATTIQPAETEQRYDGLTLVEWRRRIKDLDPIDPAAAKSVAGLMAIAGDRDAPWHSRRQAALTLGRIGPPAAAAVPLLVKLLNDTDENESATSQWAAKALALFGPVAKSAAPALIQRLKNKSARQADRQAALGALSRIGIADAGVVPALIETLSDADEDAGLRVLTAEALADIGPSASAAVPALLRAAGDQNEHLRRAAAAAIGAVGPMADVAVTTLGELLVFDESAAVRDQAADALSRIGAPATQLLTRLLADKDAEVRWRAAASLGKIRPRVESAVPPLAKALADDNAEVRINAMEALWAVERQAKPLIPFLLKEFANEDRQIRVRAYKLLVSMGDEAQPAAERLRELSDDKHPFVRQAARKAIEALKAGSVPR